jgi:hypothetical protein
LKITRLTNLALPTIKQKAKRIYQFKRVETFAIKITSGAMSSRLSILALRLKVSKKIAHTARRSKPMNLYQQQMIIKRKKSRTVFGKIA